MKDIAQENTRICIHLLRVTLAAMWRTDWRGERWSQAAPYGVLAVITRRDGGEQEEKHTGLTYTWEVKSLGLSDRWWEGGSEGAMNGS